MEQGSFATTDFGGQDMSPKAEVLDSTDARTETQRKWDKWDRRIFNPFTFILMLLCWPAWPILAVAICLWIIFAWTIHWAKGGRFAEEHSIMTVPRHHCHTCDIRHTGNCPKCGRDPFEDPLYRGWA